MRFSIRPSSARLNAADLRKANSVLSRNAALGNADCSSDRLHVGFSQFCQWVRCTGFSSNLIASTALTVHVSNIVRLASCKKMIGIDAARVVAPVTNTVSFWNCFAKKFVANPMSFFGKSCIANLTVTVR